MNLINRKWLVTIVIFFSLFFPVFAQENDLFLVVSPSSPTPNQSYSVEAKSFQFDTSYAYFEWFKNGKKIDEGTSVVKKIFAGEKVGSQTKINVSASANGNFYQALVQVDVNDIDFIISPLTYTPPFYRGRALPTPGSIVETYAIPHIFSGGSRIKTSNLIFKWELDGEIIQEQSGRGKNKFVFSLPKTPLGENEISLKVSSLNGILLHEKIEKIEIYSPQILFYETSPLVGKKIKAVTELTAPLGAQFSVSAEPFFFDFNSILRGAISWFANGTKIGPTRAENLFTLELTSSSEEESENNILFKIEDEKNVFQNKEGRITIKIRN